MSTQLKSTRLRLVGLPASEQPARTLLDSDREEAMVAPVPVDVQVARGKTNLGEAKFLHDTKAGVVLRADGDLDPVQTHLEQAVVHSHRAGSGDEPLTGVPGVDPVADLGPTRRPTKDVADGELTGEVSVDGDRERQGTRVPCLAPKVAHQTSEGLGRRIVAGWDRCLPRREPRDVAVADLLPRPGVAPRERPQPDSTGMELHGPVPAQWSLPAICCTA